MIIKNSKTTATSDGHILLEGLIQNKNDLDASKNEENDLQQFERDDNQNADLQSVNEDLELTNKPALRSENTTESRLPEDQKHQSSQLLSSLAGLDDNHLIKEEDGAPITIDFFKGYDVGEEPEDDDEEMQDLNDDDDIEADEDVLIEQQNEEFNDGVDDDEDVDPDNSTTNKRFAEDAQAQLIAGDIVLMGGF